MKKLPAQLTLGVGLKDEATFENFYPGENKEIILELKKTASGQGEKIIYLCGSKSQGYTHLLQACCHFAHQQQLSSAYLPLAHFISLSPDILQGFEKLDLICIDDLHLISGHLEWEEKIFHFYNRLYDAGGRIIMTGRALPNDLNLSLPDLISRLSWGMVFQLHALTDEEKLTVLITRANQRGITLSEEVGRYILTHCPRHMGTLFAAFDALDKASLAAQRRLTIPFVKEILQI